MKLLLVLVVFVFLAGCSEERVKPSVNTSLNEQEIPSQESWNTKVIFSDSGKTSAILYAGHLRVFDNKQETLLDNNIKVEFYNSDQEQTAVLTARNGRVDNRTNNLYAIDSVVAVSDSGVTLKTDELMWRNKDRKIVSDKFVTIVSPKEKIQGYGFESDQGLRNYTIYNITYITRLDTTNQKSKK
jgi:LPS export ABC transporter protein LptC